MSSSTPEARAIALFQAGRVAEAEQSAREALAASPRSAGALHILGCIRAQAGAAQEALALLDEAIALSPRDASMLNNRARVLVDAGRLDEAVRDLRRATQLEPAFRAARTHLAAVLRRKATTLVDAGDPASAERALREALAVNAHDAATHGNLGIALHRQGRLDEAVAAFAQAIHLQPALAEAWLNWGNALESRGDTEGAREKFARAAELAPQSAGAWLNVASNAADLGLRAEARQAYARALALEPGLASAEYGIGLLDLREQRFESGWRGYERRFDTSPPQATRRAPPLPQFQRNLAPRARVAVWTEQGIGDQLLFSTLLADLRQDADAVVEVDARLVDAYRRSAPGLHFVAAGSRDAFAGCTHQLAIGSLGAMYRPDRASFARQPRALLRADPQRVAQMRALLGDGRFIGISWRSLQPRDRGGVAARKSAPLESFAQLAHASQARLVDLQYGDVDEERAAFDAAHPGLRVPIAGLDTFGDLEGLLAAIEACDRVVTTSNVTAHLAGTIGKRTTVVFPGARSPFHYWDAVEGRRSLWYPSVEIATDARWTWAEAFAALAALR